MLRGREGQEFARKHLTTVKVDEVNWLVLHRDPTNGKYWKEYFPQAEAQGGGPPEFIQITEEEAKRIFQLP